MATKVSIFCFPLFALFLLPFKCHSIATGQASGGGGIKGMFVFGSSIVDNGNNNHLQNKAKANYLPYGIDFPGGPSGRFSNGKSMIDILSELLKLPGFIPPFADPSTNGSRIIHGVNFASGGSGILDDTGAIAGRVHCLNDQIKNFEKVTLPDLEAQLGSKSSEFLSKYLFVFGVGGNDYTFNYFIPKLHVNVRDIAFAYNLTESLSLHIKKLYSLGARKFVVMSIYPIGCAPMAKAFRPFRMDCVEGLNEAVQLYNLCLKSMVDVTTHELPGSSFVYINQYKIIKDIIENPDSYGFKEIRRGCCQEGSIIPGPQKIACKKRGTVCEDRNSYVYFDGMHPTEAVNIQISNKAFASTVKDEAYPININQLATL